MTSDFSAKEQASGRTGCRAYYIFEGGYEEMARICQAYYILRQKDQITEWLNMPELYSELPPILSTINIESKKINEKEK